MDWRRRAATRARRLGQQTVSFGANVCVRGRSELVRRGPVPGMLSFVVPVYNVEEYIDECLVSLRFQAYRNVEIICVDDGTPDDSLGIIRRHRRRDPRIRIVRRPNGGLSAARNTGVAAARGEFIAFVDSDDTVATDGYQDAVEALAASGSDFAVLPYRRVKGHVTIPASPWIRSVHRKRRVGVNIDSFPEALANAIVCSKVFRREFWQRCELSFVEGIIYEDQQVSAEAYARAHAFDVLTTPVYNWRMRVDRSSISQAKREVANLSAQFAAANKSLEVLRRYASEEVVTERVIQLLSNDMPRFTSLLVGAADDFWDVVREELPVLVDMINREDYLARVPPQQKVLQHLILTDQRSAAEEFIKLGGLSIRDARVGEEDVGLVVYLPMWRDPATSVSDDCFRVAEHQTRVRTSIRGVAVVGGSVLQVRCWAFIENVDLSDRTPRFRAFAVAEGRADVELAVHPGVDDGIDEINGHGSRYTDYRRGALDLAIDLERLSVGTWQVRLDITVDDLQRSGLLAGPWEAGTAALRHAVRGAGGRPGVVRTRSAGSFEIVLFDDGAVVCSIGLRDGVLLLTGEGPVPDLVSSKTRKGSATRTAVPVADAAGNGWSVELPVAEELDAAAAGPPQLLKLIATVAGREGPVRYAPKAAEGEVLADRARLAPLVTASGALAVQLQHRVALMRAVRVDAAELVLTLDTVGFDPEEYDAVFRSAAATSVGRVARAQGNRITVAFPYHEERWGKPERVVRSGSYEVALVHRQQKRRVVPRVAPPLLWQLPVDQIAGPVRCKVQLRPHTRTLAVAIAPPLPVECRGDRNQARLQLLSNHGRADEPAVFFRSLYGEVANDSAAAVHHELRRRDSDLTLYWSVVDHSVEVPDGGVPLIEGTREWHERLGAARYVMVNVHQPMWYRKPAGQVMIQTLHGYPYKGMGVEWWRRSNLQESRITSFLDRAEDWDYLVSPAKYATSHLLSAFFRPEGSAGVKVLETGYPRNDILLGDQAARVRARTRAALGIGDDQTAILYAPTFRDYLSVDGMTARSANFFAPVAAAEELGPKYVVLVRGHAFHARGGEDRVAAQRVVDVTYYPDVTDLCLASDAAVLDYSSLRFDYALLRRPMVFLVPDEQEYHTNRPAILPFGTTAPGPRVATTGEVVRLLRDLDGLKRKYADDVERFVTSFMQLEDGHAAERVVDAVFGRTGKRSTPTSTPTDDG